MHPCLGNRVANGHAVVYYAHAFSAGIKYRHCSRNKRLCSAHGRLYSERYGTIWEQRVCHQHMYQLQWWYDFHSFRSCTGSYFFGLQFCQTGVICDTAISHDNTVPSRPSVMKHPQPLPINQTMSIQQTLQSCSPRRLHGTRPIHSTWCHKLEIH